MAPLNPNNTDRWWCVYVNNGSEHRMLQRALPAVSSGTISANFEDIFSNLSPLMVSTVILNLEHAVAGSNVRNIVTYTGAQPTGTGTNVDNDQRARSLSFVGRDAAGHKSRFFVFGMDAFTEGDYRVDITESVDVAAVVTALNGYAASFLSINNLKPIWHAYANIGYNDHWIKQYRKG